MIPISAMSKDMRKSKNNNEKLTDNMHNQIITKNMEYSYLICPSNSIQRRDYCLLKFVLVLLVLCSFASKISSCVATRYQYQFIFKWRTPKVISRAYYFAAEHLFLKRFLPANNNFDRSQQFPYFSVLRKEWNQNRMILLNN